MTGPVGYATVRCLDTPSNNIQHHPTTPSNVQHHPTPSNNIQHPTPSNTIQRHPTASSNIQHHPTTSNNIQQHPTTSNTIHQQWGTPRPIPRLNAFSHVPQTSALVLYVVHRTSATLSALVRCTPAPAATLSRLTPPPATMVMPAPQMTNAMQARAPAQVGTDWGGRHTKLLQLRRTVIVGFPGRACRPWHGVGNLSQYNVGAVWWFVFGWEQR